MRLAGEQPLGTGWGSIAGSTLDGCSWAAAVPVRSSRRMRMVTARPTDALDRPRR